MHKPDGVQYDYVDPLAFMILDTNSNHCLTTFLAPQDAMTSSGAEASCDEEEGHDVTSDVKLLPLDLLEHVSFGDLARNDGAECV